MEMSGPTLSITLTQGTINLWFGKSAERALIARILIVIARVDSTTEHEREVVCNFEKISEFEHNGYILTSYARRNDKYRAIFVVPFSNPRALELFIKSLLDEIEHEDVRITLYWSGGRARMNIIKEELSRLNCFTLLNVIYREDQPGEQTA